MSSFKEDPDAICVDCRYSRTEHGKAGSSAFERNGCPAFNAPALLDSWSYEPKAVAFIDVLGYRAFTALPDAECRRLVSLISRHFGRRRSDPDIPRPAYGPPGARLFSDCIYLSDATSESGMYNIVIQSARLAHDLAIEGVYLRGGIAIGRHFQDVNIIFGEGIINAYELEHGRARMPRIIIDPKIIDTLPPSIHYLVAHDTDGEHFVDFWKYWHWDHTKMDIDLQFLSPSQRYARKIAAFRFAKDRFVSNLRAATESGAPGVLAKLQWLSEYHNASAAAQLLPDDATGASIPMHQTIG